MKTIKNIWSGVLIVLFTGFVVSTVFGTSQNAIQSMKQASLMKSSNSSILTY